MRAASTAAFFALSTPTQATGTPGGICTIDKSASSPSRTLFDERSGTPITGRSVWAATTPGSAAARPAPQISTRSPRSRAVLAYSATASGVRWADRTSNSYAIPRSSSSSIAACIRSRSDSEPTTMPTSANAARLRDCQVSPVPGAGERDGGSAVVGEPTRLLELVGDAGHAEDSAALRDEDVVVNRRAAVEHERAQPLRSVDALDPRAGVVA